jgi:PAS domain S-box-containing protein
MDRRKRMSQRWQALSITARFNVAFGTLLAPTILIALASIAALTVVRRKTETSIVTSTQIQRLVLEMDRGLEKARRLERDFFLRYPTVGYTVAYRDYAQPADEQVIQVRALSAELQQKISEPEVSDAWQKSHVNLNLYLSAAVRHSVTVQEAAELVAQLAADEGSSRTGAQVQWEHSTSLLQDELQSAGDPDVMILYNEMRSLEKDYLIERQRPLMQSAFNAAFPLRKAVERDPALGADQKTRALAMLDDHLAMAEDVLDLDAAMRAKFSEFDLQAEAVDPITKELIELANQEVAQARVQIRRINQWATALLGIAALAGLGLAYGVSRELSHSVIHNVVELTQVAGELQAGNLAARARIDSDDEIGQLADTLNAMALRIDSLIGDLEHTVTERTSELTASNQQLQQEIAERRQAEQALWTEKEKAQHYLDVAGVAFVALDNAGRITLINRSGLEMLGYREAELVGRDWFETCMPERLRAEGTAVFEQLMMGKIKQVEYHENPVLTRNGQERMIAWHNALLRNESGGIAGTLSSGEDITERRQAAEELTQHRDHLEDLVSARTAELNQRMAETEQLNRAMTNLLDDLQAANRTLESTSAKLQAVNQELDSFAYVVSHDLKAPLRAISQLSGWISTDYAGALDEDGQEMLQMLIGRTKRMYGLIDGILEYSRIGRVTETERQVDLNKLLRETIDLLAPPAHITVTVQEDLPIVVGEPTRLRQVFQNLVGNAVKFIDKPEGRVTVACADEGAYWRFSVADNGPGIEARHHKRIFGIFETLAPRDQVESTGIGLAVVKRIVDTWTGKAWVESTVGKGSTFYVTFPKEQSL